MSYYSKFGLEFDPFIKNDSNITVIKTSEYQEAEIRLNHLLKNRGIGVITGDAGRGKTSIIRHWSSQLSTSLYKVIYISLSTVTVTQFYQQLADKLGLEESSRKALNYKNIQSFIKNEFISKRKALVIILDEAQYISSAILSDLKMIFNFEMDSRDYAILLLVGAPTLNNVLRYKSNEALKQRISVNYHVEGLSKKETKEYINQKLKSANVNHDIFDEAALESITNASNGIPRIVDKLCSNCLLIGSVEGKVLIDTETVIKADDEMQLN